MVSSYVPVWMIDWSDPQHPKIVKMFNYVQGRIGMLPEEEHGMTFGACKEELIKKIRHYRDHWSLLLREAKALQPDD